MAFKLYQNVQKNTPLDSQENGKLKTKFKQPVSPILLANIQIFLHTHSRQQGLRMYEEGRLASPKSRLVPRILSELPQPQEPVLQADLHAGECHVSPLPTAAVHVMGKAVSSLRGCHVRRVTE